MLQGGFSLHWTVTSDHLLLAAQIEVTDSMVETIEAISYARAEGRAYDKDVRLLGEWITFGFMDTADDSINGTVYGFSGFDANDAGSYNSEDRDDGTGEGGDAGEDIDRDKGDLAFVDGVDVGFSYTVEEIDALVAQTFLTGSHSTLGYITPLTEDSLSAERPMRLASHSSSATGGGGGGAKTPSTRSSTLSSFFPNTHAPYHSQIGADMKTRHAQRGDDSGGSSGKGGCPFHYLSKLGRSPLSTQSLSASSVASSVSAAAAAGGELAHLAQAYHAQAGDFYIAPLHGTRDDIADVSAGTSTAVSGYAAHPQPRHRLQGGEQEYGHKDVEDGPVLSQSKPIESAAGSSSFSWRSEAVGGAQEEQKLGQNIVRTLIHYNASTRLLTLELKRPLQVNHTHPGVYKATDIDHTQFTRIVYARGKAYPVNAPPGTNRSELGIAHLATHRFWAVAELRFSDGSFRMIDYINEEYR